MQTRIEDVAAENDDKQETAAGGAKASLQAMQAFLRDSWAEVRHKVTWPSKKEVIGTTKVVLIATVIFATYLGGLDWLMVQFLDTVWKTAQ